MEFNSAEGIFATFFTTSPQFRNSTNNPIPRTGKSDETGGVAKHRHAAFRKIALRGFRP